ncbi:hypothetical protein C0991_010528 [Blastosporella zonata]|nr:hypothetical protein C0991_010528 [Blastosporella zonata]
MKTESLPKTWPDHLDEAIRLLNWRLLPALDYSPKELLLGLVVNTPKTNIVEASSVLRTEDVDLQMAYAEQQRLDGYAAAVHHAIKRKSTFDKRVLAESKNEVVFKKGDLVQVYRNDLDYTFKTERKLLPKWSFPRRVVARNVNSYTLATLDDSILPGNYSARRLRRFWPRQGTKLALEQSGVEEAEAGGLLPKLLEEAMLVEQERATDKFGISEMDDDTDWEDLPDDDEPSRPDLVRRRGRRHEKEGAHGVSYAMLRSDAPSTSTSTTTEETTRCL